jgi:hypothetical protein
MKVQIKGVCSKDKTAHPYSGQARHQTPRAPRYSP